MDEQKLQQFVAWLPTKFEEFGNKTPDEVANQLNELYNSDGGKEKLASLWQAFQQDIESQQMFAKGGKLNYLVETFAKGGKTKKCSCGCDLVTTMEKGGKVVTKCACGCKAKQVESYQEGGVPVQETTWAARKFGMPYKTQEVSDEKGKANIAQMLTKRNTLYRVIGRPMGGYENKTWQIISNQGTPKADTVFVSPRGNSFMPKQAPTWNAKFNQLFGTKKIKK